MAQKEIKIGDAAPDFTLKDHNGKEVKLSAMRGKKVVLGFHPLAWTSICAQQMKGLEANADEFAKLGAVALGLSIDGSFSKHAWAESLGITKTPLLADFWPHGGVAAQYGIFREADGFSERAVFIVGPDGTVRWKKVYPIKELPDMKEIMAAVSSV
jgi:peroxiredoxin